MLELPAATSPWIAAIAACAACISAFFAFRNARTARRALALSARTSQLGDPDNQIYLIDAFRYRLRDTDVAVYIFSVSIESKSTSQNSIVDAELRIPFIKDGIERTAVFRHSKNAAQNPTLNIQNLLQLPTPLPARGALVTNCSFEVHQNILAGAEYGPFVVRIKFAAGLVSDVTHNVVMDIFDAEHLEKKRKAGVPV